MELTDISWRKASGSGENGGDCVELADLPEGVAVRDSKDPDGPTLITTRAHLRIAINTARNQS
ncbi:DUF397 domain-containing protein [Actinomadura roseirufa]|uniref:DUF397 domain-containing protein n=1 Tax=Actinomadura roseirufa TaxID=2094049 RepID=UPI0010419955|nr:DUF397 domain-containing protein [Actinomadura roseirufa]